MLDYIIQHDVYSAIQIIGAKLIEYARYENDKKFTEGLIDSVAVYFAIELLSRGLIKANELTNVLGNLKDKLTKLWNAIDDFAIERVGKPIRQANGTIVFKQYNGETATPLEFYERVLKNYYKKVKARANKRELIKKRLQNNLKSFTINGNTYEEIWLPDEEYNAVHSAFTTYIMHTHYTKSILEKEYGDYVYTAILEWIEGQPLPVFVKKIKIKGVKR